MFFTLLSIFSFVGSNEHRQSRAAYIASLFFFALALLSKTQTVFVPIALLMCAWWRDRDSTSFRREAIRTGRFFVMAVVFGLITIWLQNRGIGDLVVRRQSLFADTTDGDLSAVA